MNSKENNRILGKITVKEIFKKILCLSPSPTPAPSSAPTFVPEMLSEMPSQGVTSAPTFVTSEMPSQGVTSAPTFVTSQLPSQVPSQIPSLSKIPSQEPSFVGVKQFLAPDAAFGDEFGHSVSMYGEKIVIGAPWSNDTGSIYIFSKNGTFEEQVFAFDGEEDDYFGKSVSISENYIVVGAWGYDDAKGAAYIIPFNDISSMVKIESSDNFTEYFGWKTAISGNVVAVGVPTNVNNDWGVGAVYLFSTNGTSIGNLTAPEGPTEEWFGWSIAMTDDVIVVGAPNHNDTVGAAYVYNTENGDFLMKLEPVDGLEDDYFGDDVDVYGDTIVVGSFNNYTYIYDLNGTLIQEIISPEFTGYTDHYFGFSVAVSEDFVAIAGGQYGEEKDVYVFTTEGEFIRRIDAPKPLRGDFGFDLAIEGNKLLVGASGIFGNPTIPGTGAYLYLI